MSSMSSTPGADVIVLGGGIIGAGIARELATRGVEVLLVEAAGPAAGSSGRCDGNVLVQTKHDLLGANLTLRSIEGYRKWVDELDRPLHFEQPGSLVFSTTDDGAEQAETRVGVLRALGIRADFLDADEVRSREPALQGPVTGGIDCYDDSSVYPPAVVAALLHDLRVRGGRVLSGVRAFGLVFNHAGAVEGVRTDSGTLQAPVVVNALGVWAPFLDTEDRAPLPIKPRQGVLVVTEEVPGLVQRAVTESVYMTNRVNSGEGAEAAIAFVAEPTYRGNLLLGSSRRFCGHDTSVDNSIVRAIVTRAVRNIPALSEVRAIRSFAGLRPWTPDNHPLVGTVDRIPGYVLAAGHEGEGIGLSPVTADIVAAIVLDEPTDSLLDEARTTFAPDRVYTDGQHPAPRANERAAS